MAIDLKLIDKLLADYKSPEDNHRRERSAERVVPTADQCLDAVVSPRK
jgi:hypothetical protein